MEISKNFVPSEIGEEEIPKEMIAEGKRRVVAFVTAEKMFDQLETTLDPRARASIAEEIEEFLDQNEKAIARSDNSGANDMRNFRLRLDNSKPKRAAA
jgi:hypothetical protein